MNTSFLVGYYGMKNTGDDALMNVTAWGAKRFLKSDLIVNTPVPVKLFNGSDKPAILVEKQRFPSQNRLRQYRHAMGAQNIIFGGGSVLHNARDINLKRHLMKLSTGRNHIAVGVGLGPFVDVKAEKACSKFLKECRFVGVRDKASFDIAQTIAPSANVALSFDLGPLMLQADNFKLTKLERKGIAVCLCPKERLSGHPEKEFYRLRSLAASLDCLQRLTGEVIYFVDFNGHSELGDRAVHKKVASFLSDSTQFQFEDYDANPFRVLQRMASYKMAISMRLHASVFGFLTETPVISLNYHAKCNQWCEQTGMPKSHIFDADNFDPSELIQVSLNGLENGFKENALSINTAVQAAMKNWSFNDEYAEKNSFISCCGSI